MSSTKFLIFLLILKIVNGSFVCDNRAPKQFRRFIVASTQGPVAIPDGYLTTLLDEDAEDSRRFLNVKWGGIGRIHNALSAGLATVKDFVLNTTDSSIKVGDFQAKLHLRHKTPIKIDFGAFFHHDNKCRDQPYFLSRLSELFGLKITLKSIISNYQMLKDQSDDDLQAFAIVLKEINPLTPTSLVEYVQWMINTNNVRAPFVIRLAQKLLGMMDVSYEQFRDNFKAVITNLYSEEQKGMQNDQRSTRHWTLKLGKLPKPTKRTFNIQLSLTGKLQVLATITKFIKHIVHLKQVITSALANIRITLVINPFVIISRVHELITGKLHCIKTIIKWMLAEKLYTIDLLLNRLRIIFESPESTKIKKAILKFLNIVFNIPETGNRAFNYMMTQLMIDPKSHIEIPDEYRPMETENTVKIEQEPIVKVKTLTPKQLEQKYFDLLITFMTKLLTTELSDKFAERLREAVDVTPEFVETNLPKQFVEYKVRFMGFLKWLQETIDYKQPDFELFLKKFKTVYSDNLDIRFLLVDLAKRKPNHRIELITKHLLHLIKDLGSHNPEDDPLIAYLQSIFKVPQNLKVTLTNSQSLNLFVSELLMLDDLETYDQFKSALKQIFVTKSLSAEYFIKLLNSIFKLKVTPTETLTILQDNILNLSKRTPKDVEAYKDLIHLIRFIFCQIQSTDEKPSVLLTNLQYLFIKNKQIEFYLVLENLSRMFINNNPNLNKILTYLNTELTKSKNYPKLIETLTKQIKDDDLTILTQLLTILKTIFENNNVDVDVVAPKLKDAIVTADYHIFEVEFQTQIYSLASIIDQAFNNPNGYFKKTLTVLQKHLQTSLSQQKLIQKLTQYAELNDANYQVATQWFNQFHASDLNQRVILALINLHETYQKNAESELLVILARMARDLFDLQGRFTMEEFKEVFSQAVAGIVVTRHKMAGGESVKVSFSIKIRVG